MFVAAACRHRRQLGPVPGRPAEVPHGQRRHQARSAGLPGESPQILRLLFQVESLKFVMANGATKLAVLGSQVSCFPRRQTRVESLVQNEVK